MKSRISIFAGVLLLSAAAVLSVEEQETRAEMFKRQHIFLTMKNDSCNGMIKKRKINTKGTPCKASNTFIKATWEAVKDVCGTGGKPTGPNRHSIKPFDVVECIQEYPNAVANNCRYKGTLYTNKNITITCEGGDPVHYVGISNKNSLMISSA
uniref:Ribonuclease A-domain domain-containing protein n=1 Tax=Sander lucioperca TaxID=283035 RepID=A0A8C9Y7V1_SANLU